MINLYEDSRKSDPIKQRNVVWKSCTVLFFFWKNMVMYSENPKEQKIAKGINQASACSFSFVFQNC